ncbi:hypothetical protein FV226_07655 [Methylobacterium sp. WL12]|uniref:Rz1-like lysis system protein LysC n=1 Tax=Methylobacterium sp. WL12 TaxID=2603890 RepID=UPI0011CB9866|nr:hypothetical protein [Methylobacterium sp. WL12]TXM74143.1 hypothetical protein FV226_07655 [Methylobacterium sp. WL12]
MIRVAILAALALSVAGCQTVSRSTVPASLLTCSGEPAWRKGGTQRDVASYVADLRDARADCADRLDAVGRIVGPTR